MNWNSSPLAMACTPAERLNLSMRSALEGISTETSLSLSALPNRWYCCCPSKVKSTGNDSPGVIFFTKKALPAKNLKELIAWLKANPDKALQGTPGAGSSPHIAGVFFQKATGTRFQFVSYRGLGPAMQDLLSGQIDMMIDSPPNSLPQVRAGNINVHAVTARSRLAAAPEVPTVDEAGLPGLYISVWHALFVPKGTPKAVVSKLNATAVEALADPAVQRRLADLAQEIPPRGQQTPEALGAFQKAEIEKWWPIVKAANIKAE